MNQAKLKKIIAITLVVILLCITTTVFILAVSGNSDTTFFNGMVGCMFVIPVLLYAFLLFFKYWFVFVFYINSIILLYFRNK